MGVKDWFSKSTPLTLAIERGLAPGGDLSREIWELREYKIRTQVDGNVLYAALRHVFVAWTQGARECDSSLSALVRLFQNVESRSCEAFPVMLKATPLLISIVEKAMEDPSALGTFEALLPVKILVMYGSTVGVATLIRAARGSLEPDSYLWSVIFSVVAVHPSTHREVMSALSEPLPERFIAVAMMDAANRLHIEGETLMHPFDSDAGIERIHGWLTCPDPEYFRSAKARHGGTAIFKASQAGPDDCNREAASGCACANGSGVGHGEARPRRRYRTTRQILPGREL